MAATAGFPLYLHQEGSVFLSDSEGDDRLSREGGSENEEPPLASKQQQLQSEAAMRKKTEEEDDRSSREGGLEKEKRPLESKQKLQSEAAMRKKTEEAAANVPLHPIPAMQEAFAESLIEATTEAAGLKPKLRTGDARERRNRLLDADKNSDLYYTLWRYRPGQHHHELWKLMAQISFGVYLLLKGIANSNVQVVNILQGHIDEVDEFLELTMEDISLAIDDVKERLEFLKLPTENVKTFDKMLEDRKLRLQIVTGNERIEHIVSRTTAALKASTEDVDEGLKATSQFSLYLDDQQDRAWRQERPDVIDIFDAMRGNAEGWNKAFEELHQDLTMLDSLLVKLGGMVAEMDRRAGEVSRRTRVSPDTSVSAGAGRLMDPQFSVAPFAGPGAASLRSPVASSTQSSLSLSSPAAPYADTPLAALSGELSPPRKSARRGSAGGFARDSVNSQGKVNAIYDSSPTDSGHSPDVIIVAPEFIHEDDEEGEVDDDSDDDTDTDANTITSSLKDELGDLYLLQPRIYTPQLPPERVRESESELHQLSMVAALPAPLQRGQPGRLQDSLDEPRRSSLRHRLSLRGSNPPDSIQLPPPRSSQRPRASPLHRNETSEWVESPGVEGRPQTYRAKTGPASFSDLTRPALPHAMQATTSDMALSPVGEHYQFRPVQASPHSPLQQRPWTSHQSMVPRPHTAAAHQSHPIQSRNAPSAMGTSTLSRVTNADSQTLKKKRSAFGWLKKTFSLDEEERAAFEARRQQNAPNLYNDSRSPKYLDGRRREEYRHR